MAVDVVRLEGTPQEMGLKHGTQLQEGVRGLTEERIRLVLETLHKDYPHVTKADLVALGEEHLRAQEEYSAAAYEEFRAIGEAAGVPLGELLIGNGFTDFSDVAKQRQRESHGCTAFTAGAEATADGRTYVGQTWDMHASARPFAVLFVRRPDDAPRSLVFTTAGCLSLIGINECGVCVGNNNLVPNDARPGVIYLTMLHEALRQETAAEARDCLTRAARASGHNYYVAGPEGELWDIETTATDLEIIEPGRGVFTHANHYQSDRLQEQYAAAERGENSVERERRLRELLDQKSGRLTVEHITKALSYHHERHSICRHGDYSATCGAVIMCPEGPEIWATAGYPCREEMVRLGFD